MTLIQEVANRFGSGAAFIRWSLASVFSFSMVVGLTALLHEVFLFREETAFLVPLIILFVTNFFICKFFVYRDQVGSIGQQFAAYAFSSVGFRIIEYLTYWFLIDVLNVWYLLAVFTVVPASFVCKFLVFGLFVFRSDTVSQGEAG